MYQFQKRLKYLKMHIKQWNQTTFVNIFQAQKALAQEMMDLQHKIINEGRTKTLVGKEQNLQNQLEKRRNQEEIL